jgi:hypothetical protein
MLGANTPRRVDEVLQRANAEDLVDGHGIEGVHGEGEGMHSGNMSYVNMGDTYAETLIYDVDSDTFMLGTWGGWLEAWRAEHPRLCPVCVDRPAEYNGDTGEYDLPCSTCTEEREEASGSGEHGRQFDVWVDHRLRGDGPYLVKARWLGGEDPENPLATVELSVHLPESFRGNVETNVTLLPTGILYEARGITWLDSGWRLVKDSVEKALVELDRYLEQTA